MVNRRKAWWRRGMLETGGGGRKHEEGGVKKSKVLRQASITAGWMWIIFRPQSHVDWPSLIDGRSQDVCPPPPPFYNPRSTTSSPTRSRGNGFAHFHCSKLQGIASLSDSVLTPLIQTTSAVLHLLLGVLPQSHNYMLTSFSAATQNNLWEKSLSNFYRGILSIFPQLLVLHFLILSCYGTLKYSRVGSQEA